MHRIHFTSTLLTATLLLALGLAGCGSPRPIRFYEIETPPAPARINSTRPIDILVGRITGPSFLESEPIVYRTGANEVGTYQYHRWSDPPVEMVQTNLVRLLRSSGDYQSVGIMGSGATQNLVVRGRLERFEEVDAAQISTLVAMEFELYNRKTARVLWSHSYSQSEPAQGKEVSQVVQALDRNLDRGLKEVVAGLGQYFAANPTP
jgi:ABC-type uncharacterized transport system auxiliary subunit